jgi:cytochrome c2
MIVKAAIYSAGNATGKVSGCHNVNDPASDQLGLALDAVKGRQRGSPIAL